MRVAAGSFQNGLWMPRSCLWHWPRILISTASDAYPIVWFSCRVRQEARSADPGLSFLTQNKILHCSFVRPVIISTRAFMYVLICNMNLLTYNCTSSTRQLPIDEKNVGIRWRMWMIGGFGYYILHLNFIKLDTVIVLPVDLVTITWIIRGKKRHATLFQTNDVTQSISSTLFVLHVWLLPSSYSV